MSRYYPLDALVTASGLSEAALARSIGLSGSTLKNARENGLREDAADRYAVRAGFAALEVWHDFGLRECAAKDCDVSFAQVQAHQRFCSAACSSRQRRRDRYERDPEYRERRREEARRYYETCGEYVRARNREAKRRARGTSVEHPAGLISPGQSDVSDGASRKSTTRGAVAA